MPKSQFFYIASMSFNAIRENKILAKISEFIVTDNTTPQNEDHKKKHVTVQSLDLYSHWCFCGCLVVVVFMGWILYGIFIELSVTSCSVILLYLF